MNALPPQDPKPACCGTSQPAYRRAGPLPGLAARLELFFVRHRRRIAWVHAAMFVGFLVLFGLPLLVDPAPENAGPLDHITPFARYVMWGLWFPLVFLSVVFTGRSWCGLFCPMGAAAEWANKIGPQWAIPRWVQWPGTPIVSFIIITVWGQTIGVRDHPEAMAILFGTVMAAAILLGFFFGRKKRAWCRHMCPIGLLLGVYARMGAVDFHPKRPEDGGDRWTEKGVCPTMIDLNRKTESRHCIECFRCVGPNSRGGLALQLRAPGSEVAAVADHHANLAEVMFLFLGTGAALGGFLWLVLDSYQQLRLAVGNWAIDHDWFWLGEAGPRWLMAAYPERREVLRWLDFFLIIGYMLGWTVLMTAVLSATTAAVAWMAGLFGGKPGFKARFVQLGYQYAPVAMVSLLVGLGGDLFLNLKFLGLGKENIALVKGALFAGGVVWSLGLGWKLLARQGVAAAARPLALIPGALGSLAVGAAWYSAIF